MEANISCEMERIETVVAQFVKLSNGNKRARGVEPQGSQDSQWGLGKKGYQQIPHGKGATINYINKKLCIEEQCDVNYYLQPNGENDA